MHMNLLPTKRLGQLTHIPACECVIWYGTPKSATYVSPFQYRLVPFVAEIVTAAGVESEAWASIVFGFVYSFFRLSFLRHP